AGAGPAGLADAGRAAALESDAARAAAVAHARREPAMKRRVRQSPQRQRGVALLLVLWACTMLAILLGGYAALARTEGLLARYQFAGTQAHYAAEAGLMHAVYALQDPRPKQHWVGYGRTY